ncbi:hypothetical protein FQN60_006570 [Etheostoma spectabile]|uniref:Uncharacterized protein n=1 Tax=Etheostoma spectabile TaxID=54343 RepID=A0A5J5CCM7_9PERO|nr:hypothetical protein FQN60_006570 [Etheostoma spectabile]
MMCPSSPSLTAPLATSSRAAGKARSREDPHESSQTHQLHPKFSQDAIDGAIELCSAPVQFVVHHLS